MIVHTNQSFERPDPSSVVLGEGRVECSFVLALDDVFLWTREKHNFSIGSASLSF